MDIYYLGHSSFHIKDKEVSVVTDPFSPESVGFRYPKVSAQIVSLSHGHDDHSRADLVSDVKKVISGPGEYEIEGVSIIGLPSYHDDKKGEERGENTIYVYEMGNLRLAHLGDLGHKLSEEKINSIGELDVLMVPVGGVYTIDAKTAAEVVRLLEPRVTIPMHYQVPGLNKEVFAELSGVEAFISALGYQSRQEKKLTIKPGTIEETGQEIVVLSQI